MNMPENFTTTITIIVLARLLIYIGIGYLIYLAIIKIIRELKK